MTDSNELTWSVVSEQLRLAHDPGMGTLNEVLETLATVRPAYDEVSEFLEIWFARDDLPESQLAWMLANCFGPVWRVRVLELFALASDGRERERLLEVLGTAGRLEGAWPPMLGAGAPPTSVAATDLIDLAPDSAPPTSERPVPPPYDGGQGSAVDGDLPALPSIREPTASSAQGDPIPTASPEVSAPRHARKPSFLDRILGRNKSAEPPPVADVPEPPAPHLPGARNNAKIDERTFRAARSEADPLVIEFSYSNPPSHSSRELPLGGGALKLSEVELGGGLETHWEVSSLQPLSAVDDHSTTYVHSDESGEPLLWFADFDLFVPMDQDTELRLVRLEGSGEQLLEVRVFARTTSVPLRHFTLLVPADATSAPEKSDDLAVSDFVDSLEEAQPLVSPPDALALSIYRGTTVKVRSDAKRQTTTDHWPSPPQLAGRIEEIRRAASTLRAEQLAYFEAIDRADFSATLQADLQSNLLTRLSSWQSTAYSPSGGIDVALSTAWQTVASSNSAKDLAFAGYRLFNTCFPEGSPIRPVIETMPPGSRLSFDWLLGAGNASMPWNLMYLESPGDGPIDPEMFLGLRFRIAWTKWRGASPSQVLGRANEAERLHLLYWHDDNIGAQASTQRSVMTKYQGHRIVPDHASGGSPLDQVTKELKDPTAASLLHFYCHCVHSPGGASKLVFGPTNSANPEAYEVVGRHFGAGRFSGEPFVFVNACESAMGDAYEVNQLEQMFFERGARAFLGTEVKVPIGLASRFAEVFFAFLEQPIEGTRLVTGEAATLARLYLWLNYRNIGGLFYSYVHHYGLRMTP